MLDFQRLTTMFCLVVTLCEDENTIGILTTPIDELKLVTTPHMFLEPIGYFI
jgi:hypothetical protein